MGHLKNRPAARPGSFGHSARPIRRSDSPPAASGGLPFPESTPVRLPAEDPGRSSGPAKSRQPAGSFHASSGSWPGPGEGLLPDKRASGDRFRDLKSDAEDPLLR